MPTVKTDPVLEAIACKLFGIEQVPRAEQSKMIKRAAKAAKEAAEAQVAKELEKLKADIEERDAIIECNNCEAPR